MSAEEVKKRHILLTKDISEAEFLVIRVINSVRFLPGQYLTEETVEELCADEEWRVQLDRPKGAQ